MEKSSTLTTSCHTQFSLYLSSNLPTLEVAPDTDIGYTKMKTQKILSRFGLLLGIALAFASCSKTKLQILLEAANKECPVSMGLLGEISSITYEDNTVFFNYEINEDIVNIDILESNAETLKANAIIALQNSTGETKELMAEIKNAGAGLSLAFKGKQSGKTTTFELTPEEIATIGSTSAADSDPAVQLEALLKSANMQLPREDGPGMVSESATVEGDYVVYTLKVDEDIHSIQELNAQKKQIKDNIKNMFANPDLVMQQEIAIYKNAGKGLIYKYVGNQSGETCVVEIDADEL